MKILARILPLIILLTFFTACNTVTKEQLQAVKAGDVVIWRYRKAADGKEWMYAEKITRVEGDTVYFNPGKMEATSKQDHRLNEFVTTQEDSIKRDELLKYSDITGTDEKVIIEIRK